MLNEPPLRLSAGTEPGDAGRSFGKACNYVRKARVHEQGTFLNHYCTENSQTRFSTNHLKTLLQPRDQISAEFQVQTL